MRQVPSPIDSPARTCTLALLSALALSALLSAAVTHAGPNAGARLAVDAAYASTEVDSAATSAPGQVFRVAVRIVGAVRLDGYGFLLGFDPSLAEFVSVQPGVSGEGLGNFLESRGGAGIFLGAKSRNDSTRISVADAIAGTDTAKSPSGDGLLAVLEFRAKAPGTARFTLGEAKLIDADGATDTAMSMAGASVILSEPVSARTLRADARARASLRWAAAGRGFRDALGRTSIP